MIAIRKGIKFNQVSIATKVIEAVGVSIATDNNQICIIAAYFPGGRRCSDWSLFRRDIRTMVDHDDPFFVVGDFNARSRSWNCEKNNKAGNILLQEATRSGFFVNFPDSPS